MKYRIKFGDWQTTERVYLVSEIIELTEEQAAGFLDKLELVSEATDEATPVDETVVVKNGAAVSETETESETVVVKKRKG